MPQPNILLVTSDQHRSDCLGVAGHPSVRTPHLDQLAFEGTRFTNAYTDCPICIPARTTLITGIQSHIYGKPQYAAEHRIERDRSKFLGSLMTAAGYQTQLVGKTHWHTEPSFRAGFEGLTGLDQLYAQRLRETGREYGRAGLGGNEMHPSLSQLPPHLYSTDWVIDRSCEFLRYRDKTQPFFLWTSMIDPHPPIVIHEPYYSMYDNEEIPEPIVPEWCADVSCPYDMRRHRLSYKGDRMKPNEVRKMRGVYYGMITNVDHQLGRLLGMLKIEDVWDNTIIIYTTDHGEHLCDYGDIAKTSFMEVAANLPFIVRVPGAMRERWGVEPGRTSDALVELADLLPTLCEIGGGETPDDVTGRSFMPIIRGETERTRDTLHGQIDRSHMFHDGRYKYLYFAADGAELVFDKVNDPYDEHDLSGDAALTKRLREAFIEHLHEEGHADLVDGKLRNDGQTHQPEHRVRAECPLGWPSGTRM